MPATGKSDQPVVKDDSAQMPIPSAWRGTIQQIVHALVRQDYALESEVPGVSPIPESTAAQMADYISDYGETLVDLPEESWDSSVCIWTGEEWEVLVDLWTLGEGRSDLVLSLRVVDSPDGYGFSLYMVYVP